MESMDKLYTTEQVSEYLSLPKEYIWKLIRTKKLPAVKLGKYYRVYEKDLQHFLAEAAK